MPTIGDFPRPGLWRAAVVVTLVACGQQATGADVNIPVVGQPTPFYGAAGKGVQIEASANPLALTTKDEIQFSLRVTRLLNAKDVQRPDLSALEPFHKAFQIEVDETIEPDIDGARVFRYRLRPRGVGVVSIPEFVFPYYDPNIPQPADRPELPFRKCRTQPIAIRVRQHTAPSLPPVPLEIPAFAESLARPAPTLPVWLIWLAAGAPPLLAALACGIWRYQNPTGARLVRHRRSRAARVALRRLHSLSRLAQPDVADVASCFATYLAERYDLPGVFVVPAELAQGLRASTADTDEVEVCVSFMRAIDRARFAPGAMAVVGDLINEAAHLIRRQEGES